MEPCPAPKSSAPFTVPARNWTVSGPDPRRMSPWMAGMRVALELALWVRVTPVVLALRSSATDWPAGFEIVEEPTTRPRIVSVLTTFDRVPDRSTRP